MGIMYKECTCEDWVQGMTQIDAFIMLGFAHGYKYVGGPFVYCPWCGKQIRDVEPTSEHTAAAKKVPPVSYKTTMDI